MIKVKELKKKVRELDYDITSLSDEESELFERIGYIKQHSGKLIRDYEGKLYLLLDLAENIETKDEIVTYRAMFGDCKVYAESIDSFLSKVESLDVTGTEQQYKFEFITLG